MCFDNKTGGTARTQRGEEERAPNILFVILEITPVVQLAVWDNSVAHALNVHPGFNWYHATASTFERAIRQL